MISRKSLSGKRLLFFSNLYPNPALPNQSTFNYQQVQALTEWFDVSVLSPIPWRARKVIRASREQVMEGPPVVYPTYWHTPGVFRSIYGQMMLASVAVSAKKMHNDRPFDLVLGSWLYPDGWVASRLAHYWQIPCYLKVHGTDVNRLLSGGRLTSVSLQAIKLSRGVICVSRALKTRLVELGVAEKKCHVVYNGINSEVFHPRSKSASRIQLGQSEEGIVILFVGNLLETKGLGELAKAFGNIARHKSDVRLVVAGSGCWEGRFKELIRVEGVDSRVEMLGSVNHKEIALHMNAADVLCLPSYMEGVPNVVLEALASNTTVVTTSVGGLPELACDDNRIILSLPKDSFSLQCSLERALNGEFNGTRQLSIRSWRENAASLASILTEGEV